MHCVSLASADDFDGWRKAARSFALADVAGDDISWSCGEGSDLFGAEATVLPDSGGTAFNVSRSFVKLAETVICHRDPQRFALLYALLQRVRTRPGVMEDRADPLLRRAEDMAKAVRRDIHKMRAFLRFREIEEGASSRFVAWYEPDHHILRLNAGFFLRRFSTMRWSILTPELSIHWDGATLSEGPGASRQDTPASDPVEDLWKSYYASIFNPARVKIGAMLKEMPKKYWKNMPETALVPSLIASAQRREVEMVHASRTQSHGKTIAESLDALRQEAESCQRCPLWRPATQTVFGEGPTDAPMMLVGEQPGDQEDVAGKPFVGPAGQLLDRALAEAGVDRARAYVTNAVKHFKFEQRGKRRLHAKPNGGEIQACRWWIDQERAILKPKVTVALGATAVQSLMGKAVTIGKLRGAPLMLEDGGEAWVTIHPSYLLRLPDRDLAEKEYARFVEDLKMAARAAGV